MEPTPRALVLWRTAVTVLVAAMTATFVAIGLTTPTDHEPAPGTATAPDGIAATAR